MFCRLSKLDSLQFTANVIRIAYQDLYRERGSEACGRLKMVDQDELNMWSALFSSDIKLELLRLFRNNPKLSFDSDEIAKQMGRNDFEIQDALTDLLVVGVIKKIGNQQLFCLDENKDRDLQAQLSRYLLKGVTWTPRNCCERFC